MGYGKTFGSGLWLVMSKILKAPIGIDSKGNLRWRRTKNVPNKIFVRGMFNVDSGVDMVGLMQDTNGDFAEIYNDKEKGFYVRQ